MSKVIWQNLTLSIALVCLGAAAAGTEIPYRELRALWDLTEMDFEKLSEVGSPWAILKIGPATDSGVTVGMYIDGLTGRLVREPGKDVGVEIKGSLQQILRLDGKIPARTQETYFWLVHATRRTLDVRKLLYSPFASGGMILTKYWGTANRETLFDRYYVLPETSTEMFLSYLEFRRAHRARWMNVQSKEDHHPSIQDLAQNNPIVALLAFRDFRVTDRKGNNQQEYLSPKPSVLIETAKLNNRALLIMDLLKETHSFPPAEDELKKLAAGATSLEELKPLCVAARALLDFGTYGEDSEPEKVCRRIFIQCLDALKKLPPEGELMNEINQLINQ